MVTGALKDKEILENNVDQPLRASDPTHLHFLKF